jgi:hypothetical protein
MRNKDKSNKIAWPDPRRAGVENGVIGLENGYFWDINLG